MTSAPSDNERTPAPSSRKEYVALNGMRGIAAVAVMLFHANALVGPVFPRGYLAVDLFFVLSGFVIAHAYSARLGVDISLRGFALVRILRFWPLYALGLALGVGRELLLIGSANDYALSIPLLGLAIACALVFLPLPLEQRGDNLFPLNVPSWSLFYELLVNMLYALARPWLSTKVLAAAIFASGTVLALAAPMEGIGHVGVASDSFWTGCARTVLSFGIGLLIHRHPPNVPSLPAPLLLALVAAGLAWPWGGSAYDYVFVFAISPLLVILGTTSLPRGRVASVTNWLGVISFPLYAIHRPLLHLVEAVAARVPLAPELLGWSSAIGLIGLALWANRFDVALRERLAPSLRRALRRDVTRSTAP